MSILRFQHGPHTKWVRPSVTINGWVCLPIHSQEGRSEPYDISIFTLNEWLEGPWNVEFVPTEDSPFAGGEDTHD